MKDRLSINKFMRYIFLAIFAIFYLPDFARDVQPLVYEIACAGNAPGYYVVEVSAYVSQKKDITEDSVKKCALHGVLFKGFSGTSSCVSQKPIITKMLDEEQLKIVMDLIKNDFNNYSDGIGIPLKVVKQRKKYKVTTIIQVSKDKLRKDLENIGIIKKLGF